MVYFCFRIFGLVFFVVFFFIVYLGLFCILVFELRFLGCREVF